MNIAIRIHFLCKLDSVWTCIYTDDFFRSSAEKMTDNAGTATDIKYRVVSTWRQQSINGKNFTEVPKALNSISLVNCSILIIAAYIHKIPLAANALSLSI